MEEQNFISTHEVTDEQAAALLMNDKTRRLLAPFVGSRRGVKEASAELGVKLANYYFYVKQFERAGLIEVVEVVPRAGRPVKLYQAVADEYFIPHTVGALLDAYGEDERAMHETLWRALRRAWTTNTEGVTWGLRFRKRPDGPGLGVMGAQSKGEPWDLFSGEGPIILPYWRRLSLSREKARALQLELHEVLERYTKEQGGPDTYLVRLAMAPLPKSDEPT